MKKQRSKLSKFKVAALVGAVGTLIATAPALVATGTAYVYSVAGQNLTVSATVVNICSATTTAVSFGNYSGAQLDATGTVDVTCSVNSTTVSIALGAGANWSSPTRRMANGGSFLSYGLFSDASRSTPWGDGTVGTNSAAVVAATGGQTPVSTTVYARMPANQASVVANTYTDSVSVVIAF